MNASPDAFAPFLDGFLDPGQHVHDWIMREARSAAAGHGHRLASIVDAATLRTEQGRCRRVLLDALGGLPDERPDPGIEEGRSLPRDGYSVAPLSFWSLADLRVSASLYRPTPAAAPTPGVLLLSGHAPEGKAAPAYQRVCIDLARAGMAVLAIDAFGQGEMRQCFDEAGRQVGAGNNEEHDILQMPYWLLGRNIMRYFAWNAVRALDVLAALPGIDPQRLGATGCSGGGAQVQCLLALDERVRAASVICSLSSRESYLATGSRSYDGEQVLRGCIRDGLGYDAFLAAAAPRPLLVGAAANDYFCIEGVEATCAGARRAYAAVGVSEMLALVVAPDEAHGYSRPLREASVAWLARHLGCRHPTPADDPAVEPPAALAACPTGQAVTSFAGSRPLWRRIADEWTAVRAVAPPPTAADLAARLDLDRATVPGRYRWTRRSREPGWSVERGFAICGEDEVLSSILYLPTSAPASLVVSVIPDGTAGQEAVWPLLGGLLAAGHAVCVPDLRGSGAVRMRQRNPAADHGRRSTEYRVANDLFMLGTSMVALRAADLRGHLARLRADPRLAGLPLALHACGGPAVYAMCVAAVEADLSRCLFTDCLAGWDGAFMPFPSNACLFSPTFIAPELGGAYDIPDLLRLAAHDGLRPTALARPRRTDGRAQDTGATMPSGVSLLHGEPGDDLAFLTGASGSDRGHCRV